MFSNLVRYFSKCFYFSVAVDVQHDITFGCRAHRLDICMIYQAIALPGLAPVRHRARHCDVTDPAVKHFHARKEGSLCGLLGTGSKRGEAQALAAGCGWSDPSSGRRARASPWPRPSLLGQVHWWTLDLTTGAKQHRAPLPPGQGRQRL